MIPLALRNGKMVRLDGRPVVRTFRNDVPPPEVRAEVVPAFREFLAQPCQPPTDLAGDGIVH